MQIVQITMVHGPSETDMFVRLTSAAIRTNECEIDTWGAGVIGPRFFTFFLMSGFHGQNVPSQWPEGPRFQLTIGLKAPHSVER